MLKATWRRLGSAAGLAVGLVILVPALAEAQLFPNRTIRREKPDCATEPPFYKQVRRDYFGYYPTCWSRFPAGWGCPCPDPELESMRAAYKEPDINRKPDRADDGFAPKDKPMDDPNADPNAKPADPNLPPIPEGGASPFEIDSKPKVPAGPGGTPPVRGGQPGNAGASLAPSTPAGMEMPSLPAVSPTSSNAPMIQPGGIAMYRDEATLTSASPNDRPDLGPLPTAPLPAPFTPEVSPGFVSASTPVSNGAETVIGNPQPAQAPKRRSLLGQLFGRNNTTTQNR
jgi:hypothetical protein